MPPKKDGWSRLRKMHREGGGGHKGGRGMSQSRHDQIITKRTLNRETGETECRQETEERKP